MNHLYPETSGEQEDSHAVMLMCAVLCFCCFFFVGRHRRVPLIKEITNLCIGVFHVFSSEQMATQPIVPRVCPANFLKPLGRVYTGSTHCFGGTCITNRNRARQKLCENEPDL